MARETDLQDDSADTVELLAGAPRWSSPRPAIAGLERLFCPRPQRGASRTPIPASAPRQLDEASARLMLAEAEALFTARREQVVRAEARATTLQASAGIAIGLALAGAAFLVDPTKVADRLWRVALTLILVALLACLGMAGFLANRATSKILAWHGPSVSQIVARADQSVAIACWDRATSLLRCYESNRYFSVFKIQQVKVAGLWFRAALVCFALLAVLLAIYTMVGPTPHLAR